MRKFHFLCGALWWPITAKLFVAIFSFTYFVLYSVLYFIIWFSFMFSHIIISPFYRENLIKAKYFLLEKKHHDPWVPFPKPASMVLIFWISLIFQKSFLLPKMKRSVTSSNQNSLYALLHELPYELHFIRKTSNLLAITA